MGSSSTSQRTVDGHLVVIHDATLDRTTNGTGQVFETSADVVAGFDAGGWFSDTFADERVPRLDEVLALGDIDFELEFKDYGTTPRRPWMTASAYERYVSGTWARVLAGPCTSGSRIERGIHSGGRQPCR